MLSVDSVQHNHSSSDTPETILRAVHEQEEQFEALTRELEQERRIVENQLEKVKLGSETASMSSITSTDNSFRWKHPAPHNMLVNGSTDGIGDNSRHSGSQLIDSHLRTLQDGKLQLSNGEPRHLVSATPTNDDDSQQPNYYKQMNGFVTPEQRPPGNNALPSLEPSEIPSHPHVGNGPSTTLGYDSQPSTYRSFGDANLPDSSQLPSSVYAYQKSPYNDRDNGSQPLSLSSFQSPQTSVSAAASASTSHAGKTAPPTGSIVANSDYPTASPAAFSSTKQTPSETGHNPNSISPSGLTDDAADFNHRPSELTTGPSELPTAAANSTTASTDPRLYSVSSYGGDTGSDLQPLISQYSSVQRHHATLENPNLGYIDDDAFAVQPAVPITIVPSSALPRNYEHYDDMMQQQQPFDIVHPHQLSMNDGPPHLYQTGDDSVANIPLIPNHEPSDRNATPTQFQMRQNLQPDLYFPMGRPLESENGSSVDNEMPRWRSPELYEIVEYLYHPNDAIKAHAAGYLQHLVFKNPAMKAKARELGAIPALVQLIGSGFPEVQRNVCGALRNLSYSSEINEDASKKAIKSAGGIAALMGLFERSAELDVREAITAVLWNMSSCEELKLAILDEILLPFTQLIIVPHSGWDRLMNTTSSRPDIELVWPSVFRNATGVLRNISSAGFYARRRMRETEGLVDSLLFLLRRAIQAHDIDNKCVENCVCILRNLSYRCQEFEDPDFYKKRPTLVQNPSNQGGFRSCFGLRKPPRKSPSKSTPSNSSTISSAVPRAGQQLLWQPDIVLLYLPVLAECSNPETLEAAVGAIQNLAACDWQPAIDLRAAVRKEKGLPIIVELLRIESDRVVCASATALRNLAVDPRNRELIGKYAVRHLLVKLPTSDAGHYDSNAGEDTMTAVLATLYEVVKASSSFAATVLNEGGVERMVLITRSRGQYGTKVVKFACAVLYAMWQHKDLHGDYKAKGYKEADFVTKSVQTKHGAAPNNSTLYRPKDDPGTRAYNAAQPFDTPRPIVRVRSPQPVVQQQTAPYGHDSDIPYNTQPSVVDHRSTQPSRSDYEADLDRLRRVDPGSMYSSHRPESRDDMTGYGAATPHYQAQQSDHNTAGGYFTRYEDALPENNTFQPTHPDDPIMLQTFPDRGPEMYTGPIIEEQYNPSNTGDLPSQYHQTPLSDNQAVLYDPSLPTREPLYAKVNRNRVVTASPYHTGGGGDEFFIAPANGDLRTHYTPQHTVAPDVTTGDSWV